uniref:Uncharacterized protein n=1 Tax=Trichuris muris TaxID=70415 RepID=A0A5S6Q8E9_TRIMR
MPTTGCRNDLSVSSGGRSSSSRSSSFSLAHHPSLFAFHLDKSKTGATISRPERATLGRKRSFKTCATKAAGFGRLTEWRAGSNNGRSETRPCSQGKEREGCSLLSRLTVETCQSETACREGGSWSNNKVLLPGTVRSAKRARARTAGEGDPGRSRRLIARGQRSTA